MLAACPLELEISDSYGRINRIGSSADTVVGIPNSAIINIADSIRVALLPGKDTYALSAQSIAYGEASLAIVHQFTSEGVEGVSTTIFEHIPLQDSSLLQVTDIDSSNTDFTLDLDSDGDGLMDSVVVPDTHYTTTNYSNVETESEVTDTPGAFALTQNYPNPFNPETSIDYIVDQNDHIRLIVYNVRGQVVKTLVDEYQSAGHRTTQWDGTDIDGNPVASGVYFYTIQVGGFAETKKMVLMK